jgi:lipase chaperone LimK
MKDLGNIMMSIFDDEQRNTIAIEPPLAEEDKRQSSNKKQVKFEANSTSLPVKEETVHKEEIDKLYESLNNEMKGLKGCNVDNLKEKLEAIRKNKALLENKIKEYEKKLGK